MERIFKDVETGILQAKLRRKNCALREDILAELKIRAEEWADDIVKNIDFM